MTDKPLNDNGEETAGDGADRLEVIERRVRRQSSRLEEVSEQIGQALSTIIEFQKNPPENGPGLAEGEDGDRLQSIERRVRRQSSRLEEVSEQIVQVLGAIGEVGDGTIEAGEGTARLESIEKRVRHQGALLTSVSQQIEDVLGPLAELLESSASKAEAGPGPDRLDELNRRVRQQTLRLDTLTEQMEEILSATMGLRKRHEATIRALAGDMVRLQMGVDAILRRLYLEGMELDYPTKLTVQRFRLLSQNGEDGLTLAIFREVGVAESRFVDIGCGYNGGNSGFLARELGWSGVMVDADPHRAARIRSRFNPQRVQVLEEWVTREGLNDLLRDNGATGEVDLMSIDIDGNDYWLWEELEACSPRLVIVEYNAHFGPDRAVVVPYAADFDRHKLRATYFGASLAALTALGHRKGYRLVAVEPQGINAYFLLNDIGEGIPGLTAAEAYRPKLRPKVEYDASAAGMRVRDPVAELYDYIEAQKLPLIEVE